MALRKVGPHVVRPTPAALAWAARSHVVKALDTTAPLRAAPDHAVRVFRHYFANQNLFVPANLVVGELLNALGGYRHPRLLVEVFNEIPRTLTAQHAELLEEVVPLLNGAGLRVIGPCWSTGDYEAEDWEEMRRRGWCGLDAVALHCYWGMPRGLPDGEVFTPWNALRYRSFHRPGDPPVLITECGRDMVRDAPGGRYAGNKGWKNDGLSGEEYAEELERYEAHLAEDPYVLGATVFTAGASDDWRAFDTDDVSHAFVVDPTPSAPDPAPAPEPPPPPSTTPSPTPTPVTPPHTEPPMPSTTTQLGRGLWVWYVDASGGPSGIVAACRRAGASWVLIKGGDGPSRWDQLTPDLVRAIKALAPDLAVWAWTYGYGGYVPNSAHGAARWTVEDEIRVAASCVAGTGVDGYCCDVEAEWADRSDPAQTGKRFADALRAVCDEHEVPFAYAPVPIVDNHPRLPWVQFNAVCDYAMPQLYAGNMQHITQPVWTLDRMAAHWDAWRATWEGGGLRVPPLAPVFDAYDRASADDVRADEDAVRAHPDWLGHSYWSLQHASGDLLDAMGERAAPPDPAPTPDEPPSLLDRTWALADEWAASGAPWAAQGIKAVVALSKGER